MPLLPSEGAAVSPLLTAGLLLAAIPLLDQLGLPHPTATAVIEAAGVSRSRAYQVRAEIEALAPAAIKPAGRPKKPAVEPDLAVLYRIACRSRDFAHANPGAVATGEARRRYSDGFRLFVLDLAAEHRDVPLERFAEAVGVPLPTLKDWLAGGREATRPVENLAAAPSRGPTEPQIETILAVWKTWSGSFTAFCRHVQHDWRIPFGHTLIADILEAHGVRFAKRRTGRSPDEDALRGQFETFFPNAQWVGDGSPISLVVDGVSYTFNVELMVDPCSGAVVGASVRDNEDAAAVVEAFDDGVATTGSAPLAVLLDNKPSNHAEDVKEALGDTEIMRATVGRPQNKAHVEGSYGLFQQVAPALVVTLGAPRDVARQALELVVTTWARTLNHRPRKDRDGNSRVELHLHHRPTPEEIERAEQALAERIRKQELARQTLAARQDPEVRRLLAKAFARLGLADPDGELLNAIARYPMDAVVDGIATFDGKVRAGTLPAGADARYLLGIVRNLTQDREGWEIALCLWEARRAARDVALQAAERERDRIDEHTDDVEPRVAAYVDRALATTRRIDRFFWLQAIVDAVLAEDPGLHEPLFRLAARRIHAVYAVPHRDRLAAARFLAAWLLPLAA